MIFAMVLLAIASPISDNRAAPRFCRTVHGRMMATNGTPGLRIWEIGTRHYLGISVPEELSLTSLPVNVRRKWIAATPRGNLFDASIYGDFLVCAWKPRRMGEMEMVLVIKGRNLIIGRYK